MTNLTELHALRSELASRRPKMPTRARRFASNIIEQICGIETDADIERLRPFMAYQAQRLAEASRWCRARSSTAGSTF